ncbi:hypothetical protein B0H13DRAFT_2316646 [Mycena leptocephala]|nr:hypothetical protein B0H13DRAFT_2316646 [Mycena leptocephala]
MIDAILQPEFEMFITIADGSFVKADQWGKGSEANPLFLRVLELSRYLISQPMREVVLSAMKARSLYFPPTQLIYLSYEYKTKAFFAVAFQRLISSSLRNLEKQDLIWMGFAVYEALARLKEAVQQHRCILAAEAPEFDPVHGPQHEPGCKDNAACSQDWRAVWWNGMGRFLLDGRNPLTCRVKMLDFVHGEEGNGHVYSMIDGVSNKLIGGIIEDKL